MKNLILTLDEATARWARAEAERLGVSVQQFVAGLLRERMAHDARYEQARLSYLAAGSSDLSSGSGPYPSRDELHER